MSDSTSHIRGRAVLVRDHVAASRALALFAGAGGLWVLGATATVPGFAGQGATVAVSFALGFALVVVAAAAWLGAERIPAAALLWVAPVSVLVIGFLNFITDDSSTGSQLFLLWPVLFAASFQSRRIAVIVLLQILAVEGFVLGSLQHPSQAVADTLALVLAYTMAAFAVLTFRRRVDRLLDALNAQAREDSLTGLPNRRAFDEHLSRLTRLAERSREPLSLLAVDVDRFKEVNDTRGHVVGDQVLCAVAEALRASGRDVDVVARVGGDEFAVLLPGCELEDAVSVGAVVAEQAMVHTARLGEPVSVSVGAATLSGGAMTPDALLTAADRALYASKDEGRRRSGSPLLRPG